MKHPVHNYPKHHRHPMVSPRFHPGGIPACSRWLSEAIPPESNPAASRTPAGVPAQGVLQVTVCKSVTLAAKAPKIPGRVATGFPLPSMGRGIEGEGWSYPEPPPVRFFLYQHPPASKLNTSHKIPELTLLSFYHHERAFANKGGTGHWPVPSGDPPDGTGEALFLPADIIRHWCFVILSSFNLRHSSFLN